MIEYLTVYKNVKQPTICHEKIILWLKKKTIRVLRLSPHSIPKMMLLAATCHYNSHERNIHNPNWIDLQYQMFVYHGKAKVRAKMESYIDVCVLPQDKLSSIHY